MHYRWQVLVKADSEENAKVETDRVMESIGGNGHVWDWYEIGGRWNEKKNAVPATTKTFWTRLKRAQKAQQEELELCRESLTRELEKEGKTLNDIIYNTPPNNDLGMSHYYVGKICSIVSGYYISASYIATSGEIWGSPNVPDSVIVEINKNPKEYWLVVVDLHN